MTDSANGRPRVIVVGAGFGGLNVVRHLSSAPVDVILIDRTNHHLFQPLLYQVATAALSPAEIASPIRSLFAHYDNVEVQLGEVDGVNAATNTVSIRGRGFLSYDYLVIATGAVSSWFGHADWAAHSTGLKTLHDANQLRTRLLSAFENAEGCVDPKEIKRLLTFVIIGGGASGVELAGSIRELASATLRRDFRHIHPDQARVMLFEGGPSLLAGFPERLASFARSRLERMGVEVRTGISVDAVDADGVAAGKERIATANVYWCAGVTATPVTRWLNAAAGKHGALRVNADCSVPGNDRIFAIGDVAEYIGKNGEPLPGVAPVAKQQGSYVARLIAARVSNAKTPPPFRYRDQGSLAIVGRSAAVAHLPFGNLIGVPALLIWACVHLLLLNGLRNRVLVYVQWVAAWLTFSRGARVIDSAIGSRYDCNDSETSHNRV